MLSTNSSVMYKLVAVRYWLCPFTANYIFLYLPKCNVKNKVNCCHIFKFTLTYVIWLSNYKSEIQGGMKMHRNLTFKRYCHLHQKMFFLYLSSYSSYSQKKNCEHCLHITLFKVCCKFHKFKQVLLMKLLPSGILWQYLQKKVSSIHYPTLTTITKYFISQICSA